MQSGRTFWLLPIVVAFFFGMTGYLGAYNLPTGTKRIVVLHSFHKGQKWNDDLSRGIEQVLKIDNIELNYEYLDSIRFADDDYLLRLADLLEYKYGRRRVDLVISTDEEALNFLLINRDVVFPGAAVVYCGIKFYIDRFWEREMTGVIESVDLLGNVRLARRLNPDLREIFVVMDNTSTSISLINNFIPLFSSFSPDLTFRFSPFTSFEELLDTLRQLPPDSAVFLVNYTNDSLGRVISMDESARRITESSPVPVYSVWDSYIGQGILGGKVVSGFNQGEAAARLALRVLRGKPAGKIPVQTDLSSHYVFDYQLLQKFGIKEEDLPERSRIINQPDTLYQRYRRLILTLIFGGVLLIIIIVLLSMNIMHRRGVEKSLKRYSNSLNFLHRIDQAILNNFSIETMGEQVLKPTLESVNCDLIGIYLFENDLAAAWGVGLRKGEGNSSILDLKMPIQFLPRELKDLKNTVRLGSGQADLKGVLFNHPALSRFKEFVLIPLVFQNRVLGVFYLGNHHNNRIDLEQETTCRQIADTLAMAIQNDRFLKEIKAHEVKLRDMSNNILQAQEKERKMLSAELHDEFGQVLTAIGINFSVIRKKLDKSQATAVNARMEDVETAIEHLSDQAHNLSLDLRPPMLDDLGLIPTLRWFLNRYRERSGLEIKISINGRSEEEIPDPVAVTMYRVLQETLNNVSKYACATTVFVNLDISGNAITLQVGDNGVGFDLNEVRSRKTGNRGLGLIGMRERLGLLDGFLKIKSAKNQGTTIKAVAPI